MISLLILSCGKEVKERQEFLKVKNFEGYLPEIPTTEFSDLPIDVQNDLISTDYICRLFHPEGDYPYFQFKEIFQIVRKK